MCCSDQTNEEKPEADCCANIMEMMKNCCPDQEGGNEDCCIMIKEVMARNCCPAQERNQLLG